MAFFRAKDTKLTAKLCLVGGNWALHRCESRQLPAEKEIPAAAENLAWVCQMVGKLTERVSGHKNNAAKTFSLQYRWPPLSFH